MKASSLFIITPVPTSNTWMMCGGFPASKASMPGLQRFGIGALEDRNDTIVRTGSALNSAASDWMTSAFAPLTPNQNCSSVAA